MKVKVRTKALAQEKAKNLRKKYKRVTFSKTKKGYTIYAYK